MSTPFTYAPLEVPQDWTPEQALSVYEYLNQVAEALWDRYEVDLLPLIVPSTNPADTKQLDLFDPDDELPF
jgi:hypothetical protein